MKTLRKGFTLVEMLIVIVIIGILAAALIPRLTGAQAQARDTARLADISQVNTAVSLSEADSSALPTTTGAVTTALSGLVSGGYTKGLPKDPNASRTTTFCAAQNTTNNGYGGTAGEYLYQTIQGGERMALSANTEVNKKGNWIPAASGTGCITGGTTSSTVSTNLVSSAVAGGATDSIYVLSN